MKKIAWKTLKHAHGPATRVPEQIAELASAEPPERNEAYWTLWDTLVRPGAWFEASAPAVSLLLETAAKAADPTPLLVLAAEIVGGDQLRGWLADRGAPLAPLEKAAHDAAIEQKAVLFHALDAKDGAARGAAAMALAMLPELAPESLPRLVARAGSDADDLARAGALLALGRLGAGDAAADTVLKEARGAKAALVRGAAGVSWVRQDGARSFSTARAEIEAWLGYDGAELPWFKVREWLRGLDRSNAVPRTLTALARGRGAGGVAELIELGLSLGSASKSGVVDVQVAKVLLDLGGFAGKSPVPEDSPVEVALASDLTPEQASMARKLAATSLLPAGGFGLPASGVCRRRWIGAEPPGPLDRLVSSGKKKLPLWRAWSEDFPDPSDFPSATDRWEALVEYGALTYPHCQGNLDPAEIEETLSSLPKGEEILGLASRIADDLGERFAAIARARRPNPPSLTASALLLLPLVRAKRAVEPRWDRLVHIGEEPLAREILAAVPAERREGLLCDFLGGDVSMDVVRRAVAVVDLAPTPQVIAAIERHLAALDQRMPMKARVAALRARVTEVAGKPAKKAAATEAKPAKGGGAAAKAAPATKGKSKGK